MIVKTQNNFTVKGLTQELEEYLSKELLEFEQKTLRDIDRDVPRDSHELANSIQSDFDKNNLAVRIGTDVPYAPYQEFGTIERYDGGYASSEGVSEYASQFQSAGSTKTTGGVFSRSYFFKNIRANFFQMLNRIK
jgi:hypothetical protein